MVTAPFGASMLLGSALLFAFQHQLNHAMQLFQDLKLLGLPLNTETLYFGKVPEGVSAA